MGYLDNAGLSRFTAWVKSRLSGKQDKLTAGPGLQLEGATIRAATPVVTLSQEEYDALPNKDPNVVYMTPEKGGTAGGGITEEAVDEKIQAALAGLVMPKIATGSYVGTGTFGIDTPTVVEVGFRPKFFFCFRPEYGLNTRWAALYNATLWIEGTGISNISKNGTDIAKINFSTTDTSISYYISLYNNSQPLTADEQLNTIYATYIWFAIG